jgi:O-antigen ligase
VPAALTVVVLVAPGILGRATEGFTAESRDSSQRIDQLRERGDLSTSDGTVDSYTVTAGRSIAWPIVIEWIKRHPWVGYGRQAMLSSGARLYIYNTYNEYFPHPHNAYLEALLDNGIIGALPIFLLYGFMFCYAVRMFLSRRVRPRSPSAVWPRR